MAYTNLAVLALSCLMLTTLVFSVVTATNPASSLVEAPPADVSLSAIPPVVPPTPSNDCLSPCYLKCDCSLMKTLCQGACNYCCKIYGGGTGLLPIKGGLCAKLISPVK